MIRDDDTRTALSELRLHVESVLDDVPSALREEGKRLRDALRPGLVDEADWWHRFAPLTLLYPVLQFEDREVPATLVERCAVAHVLLVLFTFLDDRFVDGQDVPRPDGAVFVATLPAMARRELRRAARCSPLPRPRGAEWEAVARRRLRRYRQARHASYDAPSRVWRDTGERWYDRLAQDRAAPGAIAALTVAITIGEPADRVETIELAYDELVSGMQWLDDLEDWEGDYLESRANSLLARACSLGESLPVPASGECAVDAAGVLEGCGAFDWGLARAEAAFGRAAGLQSELGCREIVQHIERRIERVREIRSALLHDRAKELLSRLQRGS
jgi:hypothetical protein